MGFRTPVTLSDLPDGGHYAAIFEGKAPPVRRQLCAAPGDELTALGSVAPPRRTSEPYRVGYGPDTASSCTALAVSPEICHDVNGYYRSLGVHWRADRRTLRQAYSDRNGQSSAYLTFVLRQLLDPQVRREYDLMPLGELFMDELEVMAMNARAKREAHLRGPAASQQEVLREWGYLTGEELEAKERLDTANRADQNPWQRDSHQEIWGFSHYLWKTVRNDSELAARWQIALVGALSDLDATVRFSVGLTEGLNVPFLVLREEDKITAFLDVSRAGEGFDAGALRAVAEDIAGL